MFNISLRLYRNIQHFTTFLGFNIAEKSKLMVGLFKVVDSRLDSWVFGDDFAELVRRVNTLLTAEEDSHVRAELEELLEVLSALSVVPLERTRLTQHYHLVNIASGCNQPQMSLTIPPAIPPTAGFLANPHKGSL